MNKILVGLIILVWSCHSVPRHPEGYIIEANLTGFADSTEVFLRQDSKKIDSTYLVDNHFMLKGKFPSDSIPEYLTLYLKPKKARGSYFTPLLIRNGDHVTISGSKDDFPYHLSITGSETQDRMNRFIADIRDLYDEYVRLKKTYYSLSPEKDKQRLDSIESRVSEIKKAMKRKEKEFILQNPNTFAAAVLLKHQKNFISKDTLKMLLERMRPLIRKSKYGKLIENYVNIRMVKEGGPFYDFTAVDPAGNRIKFSDLFEEDKYILLDFTSATCKPCIESLKELKQIHKQYGDKVKIISFSTDSNKETWLNSLKRDQVPWTTLWNDKGRENPVYLAYGIYGVPTFFVIGPDGKVLKSFVGYGEHMLTKILKEAGAIN